MSKLQAIIFVVLVEGRTHADVAAQFGVSRSWVTRLVGRDRVWGDAAVEPRSTRLAPHELLPLVPGIDISFGSTRLSVDAVTDMDFKTT